MDRFSLDDVREAFAADMRAVLDGIHAQVATAAEDTALVEAEAGLRQRLVPFDAIADGCHTITGSAGLVGANALVAGAGTLRNALASLQRACGEAADALAHARREAATVRALAADLDRLLAVELTTAPPHHGSGVPGPESVTATTATAADDGFDFSAKEVSAEPLATVGSTVDDIGFDFGEEPQPSPVAALPGTTASPSAASASPSAATPAIPDAIAAELRAAFAGEAAELLDAMDRWALELERSAGATATDLVRELFRHWHTIKGSANTVGLTGLGRLAHRIEDALEPLAETGATLPAANLAALTLRAQRQVRAWLDAGSDADATEVAAWEQEVAAVAALALPTDRVDAPAPASPHGDEGPNPPPSITAPSPTAARPVVADATVQTAPESRHIRVDAGQLDALMGLAGELVQGRTRLDARVGHLLALDRELRTSRERLNQTVETVRERYEFRGLDGRRTVAAAPAPSGLAARFGALELDRYEDIHVLSRTLSEIGSDIGELQSQITATLAAVGEDGDRMARTVHGIRAAVTRARLIPMGRLFTRLRLAVRDAAARAELSVQVVAEGEDVGLDKAIIDGLGGPLLHLVRNAVAHGIERPALRLAAGKSAAGVITLSAHQEAGQIVLTIADDGAGLDLAALHRTGVARGLIPAATPLHAETVRDLIFTPGLSTAASTTDVSGRGVGCDVARREIQRLGGTITVTSTPGTGTAFTIALPMTMAITRALTVRQGGRSYAVPMAFVERIVDLAPDQVVRSGGLCRFAHRDQQVVLLDLGAVLEGAPAANPGGQALLLRLGAQTWGLRIDLALTQSDVVVNSLGELLTGHPLFLGAALSGDGTLVPILDVAGLIAAGTAGPAPLARPAAPPVTPRPGLPSSRAPRVLVADDSLSVRRVADLMLRQLGCEVVLAVDGEDALAKLRQESVALVLTDLEMPKLTGYDLLREIRARPDWHDLPVVVVTSRSGDKHRQLAHDLGASGYLPKPFSADQLAEIVATWVRR